MGNPLEMIYPDGSKISQEYDIAGRLSKFFNKRGQEINYTYDANGLLVKKATPEGDINFTYDVRDRISEITGNDFHYKYSYGNCQGALVPLWNSLLVKEEDVASGRWTEQINGYYGLPWQTFDSFGWHKETRYIFTTTPVGYTPAFFSYHKRYVSASSGKGMTVSYTYDNALRIAKKANSMFHSENYNYFDANGLLSSIYYRPASGYTGYYPTGRLNFTRDQSGLIKTIAEDLAMTVNYDPDLQISSINHIVPLPFDESYTYDDNGNRLTSLTNSFTYDDLNRLTESTTHTYTYDADGNMTSEKNKLTGETKKYYYDSENRMVKYEHLASGISPVDTTAIYKYDIYGRRIQKNVNDTITNFMWEGDNLSFDLNASNQPIRKYFTETGMDDYLGHIEYSEVTNWQRLFEDTYPQGWYSYIKDQVGTIYKVWDQNAKQIVDNRTYDSFGNLINQTGTTKTPLGFQGKYYDSESGLNYFYHRYYNPAIGRFTSEDPIGFDGGENFYSFVDNDPISYIDPKGLKEECKAHGSKVLGTDISVNSFSREKFSLRLNFGGVSLYKWKVEASLIARLKCNFVCKDECQRERNYSIQTTVPYENITEYLNGPGYKVTRFGYLYRLFSTLGENKDTYLKDFFEKILKQKEFSEPNADKLCNTIFNH